MIQHLPRYCCSWCRTLTTGQTGCRSSARSLHSHLGHASWQQLDRWYGMETWDKSCTEQFEATSSGQIASTILECRYSSTCDYV